MTEKFDNKVFSVLNAIIVLFHLGSEQIYLAHATQDSIWEARSEIRISLNDSQNEHTSLQNNRYHENLAAKCIRKR